MPHDHRVFLVVVDDSPELNTALHFACLRARHTGGHVALLYVIEPVDGQQWLSIEHLIRAEKREQAEQTLQRLGGEAIEWSGRIPALYVREGDRREELLQLIEEDESISILVLGAGTGSEGPGPLVSYVAGRVAGRLRIPITIVPGALTDSQLGLLA